jgi:hypothetical protein
VAEGTLEEGLRRVAGEGEEGLVDDGFVFVLFIAADVSVGGEGFN